MEESADADSPSSAILNVRTDVDSYVARMELRLRQFKALSSRQQAVIDELRAENAALREERDGLEEARRAGSAEIARLCRGAAESAERVAELEAAAAASGARADADEGDGKHVFVDVREPTFHGLSHETCEGSRAQKPGVSAEERDCQDCQGVYERRAGHNAVSMLCRCANTPPGLSERRGPQLTETEAGSRSGPGSLTEIVDKENSSVVNALKDFSLQPSRTGETERKGAKDYLALRQVARTTRGRGTPVRGAQAVYASSRSVAKYAFSILRSTTRG